MGDISAWVAVGLTALALTAGCVAYIHGQISAVHNRISTARDHVELKVAEAKKEVEADITTEREERRREHDRLERAIDSFAVVGTAVTAMVEGVRHLGERLEDHRKSSDRSMDELKHGMRQMDARIQAMTQNGGQVNVNAK